ncbi:hypothetical protein C2G38_2067748 [Gigaspora rosea]|uniref:Uncharacterized protein n=1 Tax=Gigaspora rosea TaxID=44941 RepID=A0A397VRY4_9GLOM|nr:hypothetical protein C2G38_2067748 [Gigaspora rosea]
MKLELTSKLLEKKETDQEKQKLKSEQQKLKSKLKSEQQKLKQKALEIVRIEIKSVQDKLDSEEFKEVSTINRSVLDLELRQKKIKQELVEIKLELDQNSDLKEKEKLKSDSRYKKIELIEKEIEWTQTKLKWTQEIKLISELNSKRQELRYRWIKYYLNIDCKKCFLFKYFLFKNLNTNKLYIYDNIEYNDNEMLLREKKNSSEVSR